MKFIDNFDSPNHSSHYLYEWYYVNIQSRYQIFVPANSSRCCSSK